METKFALSASVRRGCATLFVIPDEVLDEFLENIHSDNLQIFDELSSIRPAVEQDDLDISQVEFWPSKSDRFLFTV